MAEPAICIDVGSALRGLGTTLTKYGSVLSPPTAKCPAPLVVRTTGTTTAGVCVSKPRANRDPHGIVSGRLMAESKWAPAIVDDRDIQQVIGMTSRMDGRRQLVLRGR